MKIKIDNKSESIDIEHIARLSQLEFSDDELECIYKDMIDIIEMIDELPYIDKDKEHEYFCTEENSNSLPELREDIIIDNEITHKEILKNAPYVHNGFLSIPKTV